MRGMPPPARGVGASRTALSAIYAGALAKTVQLDGAGTSPATVSINSQPGSTILLLRGGAHADNANPTDSKGNTLTQRGTDQGYAGGLWPGYGLEIWGVVNAAGGSAHQLSTVKSHTDWEITKVMWEVRGGSEIILTQGSAAAAGAGVAYNSPTITLTKPGLVFAIASTDGNAATPDQTITPSAGWTMFDSDFRAATAYVPYAIASRYFAAAGTYQMQWTPVVSQGSAMIMVAIQ